MTYIWPSNSKWPTYLISRIIFLNGMAYNFAQYIIFSFCRVKEFKYDIVLVIWPKFDFQIQNSCQYLHLNWSYITWYFMYLNDFGAKYAVFNDAQFNGIHFMTFEGQSHTLILKVKIVKSELCWICQWKVQMIKSYWCLYLI